MAEQDVDWALVRRVQAGEKAAFDLLVRKYQQKVMNLVSRYVKDNAEVMDVTQEAFIKAYRALPNFRGESAFYTWLYRVAINTSKNYLVARNRRPPSSDVDAVEAEVYANADLLRENASPERLLLSQELKQVLFEAIEKLPKDLKTAIMLRELEGMSYEQIAEQMDCPVGTVRSRIFRAREIIDDKIKPLIRD
ncbi:MAG: RNA polymerase sigma factor RpoE [Gammaproteobacteria bacterium]|nr:RNA polymerase sigma factor RpoE [Gammaproteobacteria bacterium]NNJ72380.1 RNA polymerase sigma factor RpoE [Enterobacterales bacterium]